MSKRSPKPKEWKSAGSWWGHASLNHFDSLLSFANIKITEDNWRDLIWEAMGNERLVTYSTAEGSQIAYAVDVHDVTLETEPVMGGISGKAATFDLTKAIQEKVRHVLNLLVEAANSVHRQRSGQEGTAWLERFKMKRAKLLYAPHPGQNGSGWVEEVKHPDGSEITRDELNFYASLPWSATHLEERQNLHKVIEREFNAPDSRQAIVHYTGFIAFSDDGKDASITLGWMLMGLIEVVFRKSWPYLKICAWCGKYFFHETLRHKRFCSDPCRFNSNNKGR